VFRLSNLFPDRRRIAVQPRPRRAGGGRARQGRPRYAALQGAFDAERSASGATPRRARDDRPAFLGERRPASRRFARRRRRWSKQATRRRAAYNDRPTTCFPTFITTHLPISGWVGPDDRGDLSPRRMSGERAAELNARPGGRSTNHRLSYRRHFVHRRQRIGTTCLVSEAGDDLLGPGRPAVGSRCFRGEPGLAHRVGGVVKPLRIVLSTARCSGVFILAILTKAAADGSRGISGDLLSRDGGSCSRWRCS